MLKALKPVLVITLTVTVTKLTISHVCSHVDDHVFQEGGSEISVNFTKY